MNHDWEQIGDHYDKCIGCGKVILISDNGGGECKPEKTMTEIETSILNLFNRQVERLLEYEDFEKCYEQMLILTTDIEELIPPSNVRNLIVDNFKRVVKIIQEKIENENKL